MLNKLFRLIFPPKDFNYLYQKYNIPRSIDFKFEIRKDGWFVATSQALPGFITEARNPQELLQMINDAILTYFDVPKREADIIHNSLNIHGYGNVTLGEQYKLA